MATTIFGHRILNTRGGRRSFQRRRDSEEENILIDFNREPEIVLKEILFHIVKLDVTKSRKLAYLNGFVRFCTKYGSCSKFGFSYKEIFCCVRVTLFHEACEVRAAGLRVCRYILQNNEALEAFCEMKLPFLVARSLDISLDNRLERIHAIRLMRKILCLNPSAFPCVFTRCLVAIANEDSQERDMVRACLATLSQLFLFNPEACAETNGISVLIKNVLDCPQPQISEAVTGVVLYLYNDPRTRKLLRNSFGLEHLLAPFTDCHYRYPSEVADNISSDDHESKLTASRYTLIAILRSWPGITYLSESSHPELPSLVEMLYLPYEDIRKNIVDLLYEVFNVPIPDWTNDFLAAAASADPSAPQNSWQLFESFVVAEGYSVLPYTSKDRMNLIENYFALLLLVFVHAGLLEALTEVIVSSEVHLAVRATILLGELLYMSNQLLPSDCSHHCQSLPTLVSSGASFQTPQQQNQASAAVTCLYRINELKKRGAVPYSLVLENTLSVCNPERNYKSFFVGTVSKIKLSKYIKKDFSDTIDQAVKDSQVISQEYFCWDWELIDSILKNPGETLKKIEEPNHRIFIRKLLQFFKPTSKQFSEIGVDTERGKQICLTGCHFLEFLLELDEENSQEYLEELMSDINTCLKEVVVENVPLAAILSPAKVLNTLSYVYFLFFGKMSSSSKGSKYLYRFGTFQNLLQLVSITTQDVYIKLVVSTLDYSKEGFTRTVLSKILTGTFENARLYATNYLCILLRAGLLDYRNWAIEFLVTQLYDSSKKVSNAAAEILDEACNVPENLETFISLRPSLLHLGDKGLLLILRFISVPSGFHFLQESNFLQCELEKWRKVHNLRYVKIVEDLLNEALTRHRKGEDGTYGRRSSDVRHTVQNVYLPHHMYGQLVQHPDGLEMLLNENILDELFAIIRCPDFSSEISVLFLKASLWALGHIGSYPLGLPLLQQVEVISIIAKLAAEAPVLSVRGTCFFVLGLLSSTPEGSALLAEVEWEAVQRNHEEKWPLIKGNLSRIKIKQCQLHSCSVSSAESDWRLGNLPYSPSYIMAASNPGLCISHSSQSLNIEGANKSSASSSSSVLLDNKPELFDARPRSSSDCQPKENFKILNLDSTSWDSLDPELSNGYKEVEQPTGNVLKERSVSSYEMRSGAFVLNPEDTVVSNEHASSSSINNSASKYSESIHEQIEQTVEQNEVLKNPVRVSTSVSASLRFIQGNAEHHSLSKQLSRHSYYLHSPTSPENAPVFSFSSPRDAQGYITLRNIQRRRVQSLSFQDANTYHIDDDLCDPKSQSLRVQNGSTFSQSSNSLKSSSLSSETSEAAVIQSSSQTMRFIGLCLPSHFDLLFNVPKECSIIYDESDKNEVSNSNENMGFEFHTIANCLASHDLHGKTGLIQITIREEGTESSAITDISNGVDIEKIATSEGCVKLTEETFEGKVLLHKEIMRCVANLVSSIAVKASEQGLLSLKQRFPNTFQNICLYSEVCLHMSKYNFSLPARRFLQELFLDISFDQLYLEAETIVGVTNLPQKTGDDAEPSS